MKKETSKERILKNNPLPINWKNLQVGDLVKKFSPTKNEEKIWFVINHNKKKKRIKFIILDENKIIDRTYLEFENFYCLAIIREGIICYNLRDLKNVK